MIRQHLSGIELVEYLDGALRAARARWAEAHLGQCETCAQSLAEMRSGAEAMRSLTEVAAPEGLRERVLREVGAVTGARLTCREAAPLLHPHLEAQLAPLLEMGLQSHLQRCERCRAEVMALRAARRLVQSLPTVVPPESVRTAVEAARRAAPSRAPWSAHVRPALAAAGVAAAVGLLVLLRGPASDRVPAAPTSIAQLPTASAELPPGPISSAETAASDAAASAAIETEARSGRETLPEPRAVARAVIATPPPKGPSPAPTSDDETFAEVSLPSALRILKAVAGGAAHDREVQWAMEEAGERFATLRSEAMLHLPEEMSAPGPAEAAPGESGPEVSPDAFISPEEMGEIAPKARKDNNVAGNSTAAWAV